MATKKKAEESGATATLDAPLPPGFSTKVNRCFSPAVAQRFDTLLPTASVVRLLLVAGKAGSDEEIRGIFTSPRFALRKKAPGVFEVTVMAKDLDAAIVPNVGAEKAFKWVDLPHRFYGLAVPGAEDLAQVAVIFDGTPAEGKKKLKALGVEVEEASAVEGEDLGDWVDPDAGYLIGKIAGAKLAGLVLEPKVLAAEVRGVASAS